MNKTVIKIITNKYLFCKFSIIWMHYDIVNKIFTFVTRVLFLKMFETIINNFEKLWKLIIYERTRAIALSEGPLLIKLEIILLIYKIFLLIFFNSLTLRFKLIKVTFFLSYWDKIFLNFLVRWNLSILFFNYNKWNF